MGEILGTAPAIAAIPAVCPRAGATASVCFTCPGSFEESSSTESPSYVRQASRVGGRQRKGTTNRPFRDAVLNLSADRSEHFGECDNVLCFWRGTCLWQGFGPLDSAPPVSDGERGQAGVVPRWFVTSDGRIRHVEMRLQWTCLAVWFLGCSVQEC